MDPLFASAMGSAPWGNPFGLFQEPPGGEPGGGGGESPPAESPPAESPPAESPPAESPPAESPPPPPDSTWRDRLLGEEQENPTFAPYEDTEDGLKNLLKSYGEQAKLLGKDKMPVPKADDPEAMEAVFKAMGRPDDPAGYDMGFMSQRQWPEGAGPDTALYGKLTPLFHKAGLNQGQVEILANGFTDMQLENFKELNTTQAAKGQEWAQEMDEAWGPKGSPSHKKQLELANRGINALTRDMGVDDHNALADAFNNYPPFMKLMAKVGEVLAEDKDLIGDGQRRGKIYTPAEAKRQIAAIQGDPKHPFHDKDRPGHDYAVTEMEALFAAAYPETKEA